MFWSYFDHQAVEIARQEKARIAGYTDDELTALIEFYDHPRIERFYTSLISKLKAEQMKRGDSGNAGRYNKAG